MKQIFKRVTLLVILITSSHQALAQVAQIKEQQEVDTGDYHLFVERITYDDYIYSKSRKTEVGDQMNLGTALRYQFTDHTFIRGRFRTSPNDNEVDNETSEFELLFNHQYKQIFFRMDLSLDTDAGSTGGTSIGLDTDSDDTLLTWIPNDNFSLTFYPFNFNGAVGDMFYTWHINRYYNITGAPTTIAATPANNEEVVVKTIPGLEFQYTFKNGLSAYVGGGVGSYLYPSNGNFDLISNANPTRWERREALGYKAGLFYRDKGKLRFRLQLVGQNKTEETGALIEQGASINTRFRLSNFIVQLEATGTRAGRAPWRLNNGGDWFELFGASQPYYQDNSTGAIQDWVGQTDFAYGLKFGYDLGHATPFFSAEYLGKNFVFNDIRESAHTLRTNDETQSHGGLLQLGLGSHFYVGRYMIVPQISYRRANNPVFTSSSDARADRKLASFEKEDYVASLNLVYSVNDWLFFVP